jgi:hypothetical protein
MNDREAKIGQELLQPYLIQDLQNIVLDYIGKTIYVDAHFERDSTEFNALYDSDLESFEHRNWKKRVSQNTTAIESKFQKTKIPPSFFIVKDDESFKQLTDEQFNFQKLSCLEIAPKFTEKCKKHFQIQVPPITLLILDDKEDKDDKSFNNFNFISIFTSLESLSLSFENCNKISSDFFDDLEKCSYGLKSLSIYNKGNISWNALVNFLQKAKSLRSLQISCFYFCLESSTEKYLLPSLEKSSIEHIDLYQFTNTPKLFLNSPRLLYIDVSGFDVTLGPNCLPLCLKTTVQAPSWKSFINTQELRINDEKVMQVLFDKTAQDDSNFQKFQKENSPQSTVTNNSEFKWKFKKLIFDDILELNQVIQLVNKSPDLIKFHFYNTELNCSLVQFNDCFYKNVKQLCLNQQEINIQEFVNSGLHFRQLEKVDFYFYKFGQKKKSDDYKYFALFVQQHSTLTKVDIDSFHSDDIEMKLLYFDLWSKISHLKELSFGFYTQAQVLEMMKCWNKSPLLNSLVEFSFRFSSKEENPELIAHGQVESFFNSHDVKVYHV